MKRREQRCRHTSHGVLMVDFYGPVGPVTVPTYEGFDPVTRSWQACDEGIAGVPQSFKVKPHRNEFDKRVSGFIARVADITQWASR